MEPSLKVNSYISPQQEWQGAQQRLLCYLRLLKIPPVEGLQLTLEALKLAMQSPKSPPGGSPVLRAMRALRTLLTEQISSSEDSRGQGGYFKDDYLRQLVRRDFGLPTTLGSMPPLNRGSMVPEGVD